MQHCVIAQKKPEKLPLKIEIRHDFDDEFHHQFSYLQNHRPKPRLLHRVFK